ncbi:MAG: glutamine--fructose-6-phosphate transaminase (isomerizing), partial [Idiomarina sp.]|nr:glutamine--fructose-6-phosphate transaminase (isomerizing) [Idiomarina sp.]
MCGIVGATSERRVTGILLEGLKRLEYRGYDSAGVAVIDADKHLKSVRRTGKVQELKDAIDQNPLDGTIGIAHTRWATHGGVTEANAHPHRSEDQIAVVHNGIIENHERLREELKAEGYVFNSQTDTEVIAHLIHHERKTHGDLLAAVKSAVRQLEGAYGTVVMDTQYPERLVVARSGSPLVIGVGIGENFVASDQLALLPVTRQFIYLEEGDVADINRTEIDIYDAEGNAVEREIIESDVSYDAGGKGEYRHFMLKEIYEQPIAVRNTLEGRLSETSVLDNAFGENAADILKGIEHVQIVACGTSYHAGMVARYWLESMANVSCNIEIASEFRYRKSYVHPNSLLVTISQSGETADTLAALRLSKELGYKGSLTICNVGSSSMVRESDLAFLTRAGAEIGVASTKAFTTQLTGLLMLTLGIGKYRGMPEQQQEAVVHALQALPAKLEEAVSLADEIEELAQDFANKEHS